MRNRMFYGNRTTEADLPYPVGDDQAYILDTGNDDIRSEGMSYGMMICVQMDKKPSSTICGNGQKPICNFKPDLQKAISRGRYQKMEVQKAHNRHLMAMSILPWL